MEGPLCARTRYLILFSQQSCAIYVNISVLQIRNVSLGPSMFLAHSHGL